MDTDLTAQIDLVRQATGRLIADLDRLTDADVARPSLCPGWSVGHVLNHIARSGDAQRRGLEGAARGEPVPMYESRAARAADIEAGAGRPIGELVADVRQSARLLDETWPLLDAAAWAREIPHPLGPRPVRGMPATRLGEVEIHHVDLAGGYGPGDWPAAFVARVLSTSGGALADRLPAGVAVDVLASDTGARWHAGDARARPIAVSGPSWAVAAWLLGRADPVRADLSTVDGDLPVLTPWL